MATERESRFDLLPPRPTLVVGRSEDLRNLKGHLGVGSDSGGAGKLRVLTTIRGWPGVGKTTIASALAHDCDVQEAFTDGILWASLGPDPDLFATLSGWGRAVRSDVLRASTLNEAAAVLRGRLQSLKMLLIVDDVWDAKHLALLQIGGPDCAVLATTRLSRVAQEIAPTPESVVKLDVLSDEDALVLFGTLAPGVVHRHEESAIELLRELEGLPLAIQVAGRLLHTESEYGFSIETLLSELKAGKHVLSATAPVSALAGHDDVPATVELLLKKSTDRLDPVTRARYASLGSLAPKPTTFDIRALSAIWETEDPKPTIRNLVDRGLLESIAGTERFQMHALLVWHARSLCS